MKSNSDQSNKNAKNSANSKARKPVEGKEAESRIVENLLQAKQPAEIHEYSEVGTKDIGMSEGGFIGSKNDQRYMLKPGSMNPQDHKQKTDRNNVIYEYMAPFDRFLYDRAPVIGAATKGEKETPDSIYLRSKMIENTELLNSYISLDYKSTVNPSKIINDTQVVIYSNNNKLMWRRGENTPKEIQISDNISEGIPERIYTAILEGKKVESYDFNLIKQHGVHQFGYPKETQKMQGLEKILATCMFMGDNDFHAKNILVLDDNGQQILLKIDHGKAIYFYDNEQDLRKNLIQGMNRSLYQKMDFDIVKLKDAIDEITKISDEEIETLVKARSYQLRKMGFKLDDDLTYYVNDKKSMLAEGYKIRLLKNVNENQSLTEGQIALGIEDGKLICQIHGKEKIEIINQPELKEFIEKAERGENPGPSAPYIPKIIEHLNDTNKGYLISDQELRYSNLEKNYTNLYKKQRAALQELSTKLELVQDMDRPDQWKQRDWLHEIQGGDVKEWAAANDVSFRSPANNSLSSEQLMLKIESALLKEDIDSVKIIITENNSPNIADQNGSTILHKAVEENSIELVEFLLKQQALTNIPEQEEGNTPVFLAVHSGNFEIVELLHKHGADLNYATKEGLTPLYVAMLQENHEMVQKLIELGADPKQKPDCLDISKWQDLCKEYIISNSTAEKTTSQNSQIDTPSTTMASYALSEDENSTGTVSFDNPYSKFSNIEEMNDPDLINMLSKIDQDCHRKISITIESTAISPTSPIPLRVSPLESNNKGIKGY